MDESISKAQAEPRREEPPALEGITEGISTRVNYSLRFTGWPNMSQLVAIAVATATYTVLSYLTVRFISSPVQSVSLIFLAIFFGVPFALWFGGWAVVIAYIGNFVGAGILTGTPVLPSLPFGVADLIQLCIPMVLYRLLAPRFGVNAIGKDVLTLRGYLFYAIVGVIPWNILGGLYGVWLLLVNQLVPPDAFLYGWAIWSVSNIVLLLVIGPVVLSQIGPVVERAGLTVHDALR